MSPPGSSHWVLGAVAPTSRPMPRVPSRAATRISCPTTTRPRDAVTSRPIEAVSGKKSPRNTDVWERCGISTWLRPEGIWSPLSVSTRTVTTASSRKGFVTSR